MDEFLEYEITSEIVERSNEASSDAYALAKDVIETAIHEMFGSLINADTDERFTMRTNTVAIVIDDHEPTHYDLPFSYPKRSNAHGPITFRISGDTITENAYGIPLTPALADALIAYRNAYAPVLVLQERLVDAMDNAENATELASLVPEGAYLFSNALKEEVDEREERETMRKEAIAYLEENKDDDDIEGAVSAFIEAFTADPPTIIKDAIDSVEMLKGFVEEADTIEFIAYAKAFGDTCSASHIATLPFRYAMLYDFDGSRVFAPIEIRRYSRGIGTNYGETLTNEQVKAAEKVLEILERKAVRDYAKELAKG